MLFFHPVRNLHFVMSSESSGVVKTIKNDLFETLVKFRVVKSANLWSEKLNNRLLKKPINVFNMKFSWWCSVYFFVVYLKFGCKMAKPKKA